MSCPPPPPHSPGNTIICFCDVSQTVLCAYIYIYAVHIAHIRKLCTHKKYTYVHDKKYAHWKKLCAYTKNIAQKKRVYTVTKNVCTEIEKKKKRFSTRMGFEPMRAEHNGLAVHRLNHSATLSAQFFLTTKRPPDVILRRSFTRPSTALAVIEGLGTRLTRTSG